MRFIPASFHTLQNQSVDRTMKLFVPSIYLICLLLFITTPALAEVLNIATIDLLPYGYTENGQPTGLNYELANIIAKEAGYTPNNSIVPLARATHYIETGRMDVVIMFSTPFILTHADNLGLVLPMETVVLSRADTIIDTLQDLSGKTVATVRGAKYDDRVSKINDIVLYPTRNYTQSLKMLLFGRVDAVIGPILGLSYTAKENNFSKQDFSTPFILSTAQGNLFLSKKSSSTDKKQRLSNALKHLKKNGTLQSILNKYSL